MKNKKGFRKNNKMQIFGGPTTDLLVGIYGNGGGNLHSRHVLQVIFKSTLRNTVLALDLKER